MNSNVKILFDRTMVGLGIADERVRHEAFQWLLPVAAGEQRFWERWAGQLRPASREWHLGMTSLGEQAYCEWYASELYTGAGEIVELGCWLGSLTKALVHGLRRNRRLATRKPVHAYDHFRWHHSFAEAVRSSPLANNTYKDGDDFFPLYLASIEEVLDAVVPHQGDLCVERWGGGAIEFLVVDAMKYEALVRNIQGSFFPALMPGKSVLMHQDYLHFYEGWIHIAMFRMRDIFSPICTLPETMSVLFRCNRHPEGEALEFPESVASLPPDLVEDAFAWSSNLVPEEARDKVAAAHTMVYVHRGDQEAARRLYHRYCVQGPYRSSMEFGALVEYLKNDRGIVL